MVWRVPQRRTLTLLAIGLATYTAALIALLPARFVIAPTDDRWMLAGTVWRGEAVLAGSHRLEWRFAPVRSLAALGFAADWRMTGQGTDLTGTATVGSRETRLEGVSGQADGGLLAALEPSLPFTCDVTMQVDLADLAIGGTSQRATGTIRTDPGRCTAKGIASASTALPRLTATMRRAGDLSDGFVAPAANRQKLVTISLSKRGRLVVAVTPAGGALLPFVRDFALTRDL